MTTLEAFTTQQLMTLRRDCLVLVGTIELLLKARGEWKGPLTSQLRKEYKTALSAQQTSTLPVMEIILT